MTDPERMSRRGSGLAAQLLRSSADEAPSDASMQRTLAALGVSGALLTTTSVAGAASAKVASAVTASAASATSAATAGKTVTGALLLKWVGVGVVSGVGLAGTAALVTSPPTATTSEIAKPAPRVASRVGRATARAVPPGEPEAPLEAPAVPAAPTRTAVSARGPTTAPVSDSAAPLAAEVAYVDEARDQLAAGDTELGLSRLARYGRDFPEARLLPEVLFLQLETYQRLGRTAEARRAAERLVAAFPRSPHAARARSLLEARFP